MEVQHLEHFKLKMSTESCWGLGCFDEVHLSSLELNTEHHLENQQHKDDTSCQRGASSPSK